MINLIERIIKLNINGEIHEVTAKPYDSLLVILREQIGLKAAKQGCDYGGCGACTVLLDDKAVYSCMTPVSRAQGKTITTVEGLINDGKLHPLQNTFIKKWAVQCGFCSAGIILSAKALLDANPTPTKVEVREAIVGNLCSCTGYTKIVEAILAAAEDINKAATSEPSS